MSIISRILLDSSFFVESYKGRNPKFYQYVTEHPSLDCCYTEIVCSEYWFHLFGMIGDKAPLTLKGSKMLPSIVTTHQARFCFFDRYTLISSTSQNIALSLEAVQKHNLLPNDALILGACIGSSITFLASYDTDFTSPCSHEGITLITPENYLKLLPKLKA